MRKNRRSIVAIVALGCVLAVALSAQTGSASGEELSKRDISDALVATSIPTDIVNTQSATDVLIPQNALNIFDNRIDLAAVTTLSTNSYDIANGSVTCDQGGTLYTITGTSTSHTITVKGGTAQNPVRVDLAGVTMKFQGEEDGDSTEASPLTVEDGAYAIIYIGGNDASVVDTLTGGNEHGVGKNTGYAGICVKSGAHVTIAGQGTLNVTGGGVQYGAAAIGGNYDEDVHDLTIAGNVTINATGGYSAPGIGSGRDGELYSLVINGGTINATGGKYAPGIGAGDAVGTGGGGTTHSITIYGGTITATGGYKAAGIGGSEGGSAGSITITGGTITAIGGEEGAGIGGGSGGDVSSIYITGGTITATGGANGAGIGGGKGADSGEITIAEGSPAALSITAQGGENGAGIGSAGHDSGTIDVTLDGGTIAATGGDSGAGIGAGDADADSITIQGSGTVSAKGGKQGCGIGAGEDSTAVGITIEGTVTQSSGSRPLTINAEALTVDPADGTSQLFYANKNAAIGSGRTECGPIDIRNAVVNAAANGYGADIGGGYNHGWNPASVKSIHISNCTVKSQDFDKNVPNDKVAPSIGAGTDGNVGTIEIYNSDVTGAGIGAASENFDDCNAVDSITIQGCSNVSAIRQDVGWDASNSRSQAAGIGSGIGGDIGSIDIEDSTVTAQGVGGGAGIGSGGVSGESYSEGADPGISDVGTITIKRSNITATGSVQKVTDELKSGGAGIGLGFAVKGSGTIHSILIDQCNSVVATGAWGAAGIGTSCGSNFTSGNDGDGNVTITGSGVTATGGYGAAGIGAGMQLNAHGGDARIIKITGASAITAAGGEGAAGIGGGKDGGVDAVTIALERVDLTTMRTQYVTATGGLGAAGIGSGSGGHDAGSVTIQSGYVTAKGGTDLDGKGTGAGIGGGNAKGVLKNLSISGGIIYASAGSSDAYDIGCGGTGSALSTDQNGTFTITNGTVLATNIGYAKTMIVTGGSVLANLTNACDAAHSPVYRTTLTLPIGNYTQANVSSFVDGYGTNDIYSDGNRKVYLYRTTTDAFKASADVTTAYQATAYHYVGQTLADGTGMLKMQPQFSFKDPETTPVVGDTFQIDVDDSALTSRWGDCVYTVSAFSGCVSETNNPPSNARHTGAYISLEAKSIGTYTVTATCAAPPESADVYWPVSATYTGTVTQQAGAISITEDPSKIYDSTAVVDPSVTTTGDGAVTYTYYTGTDTSVAGAKLNAAPVDQGTYTVVASMAGTDHYTAASASESFTITPRPITLGLSASLSDDKGTATLLATVLNAVDTQGDVDFTITKPDGTTKDVTGTIAASGDAYVAQVSFTDVGTGTYTVVATYVSAMSGDYSCATTASASFNKEYVTRSINVDSSVTAAYGDKTFNLNAAASTSEGANDQFAYEVSSDEFAAYGLNPTILVDAAGNVTPTNAGVATVKITLTDSNNVYAPETAYVKVTVTRAKLTVTPYVKDSSGNTITEATYGSLGGLTYGLTSVGLKGEDTVDNFDGHGKLEAVPLATTADVGTYTIGIKRVGDGSVTINGTTYYNVFVSRNYEIDEVASDFTVKPATLTVTANDATGTWGGTEPAYGVSVSGFVLSDTASTVFSKQPTATLDTTQTDGKAFSALEPGEYGSAVSATAGTLNTDASGKNYTVGTTAGTLTVAKADPALAISVDSKTYDGNAVAPKVTTSTSPAFDGTCTVTYYPLDSETALSGAPTDAGQYRAVATVKDASHFADDTAACLFTIAKVSSSITIMGDPGKTYDGKAVADPAVNKNGTGAVTYAYYTGTDTAATPLTSNPSDAGDYTVVATVASDNNCTFATDSKSFTIAKATPDVETPTLSNLTYEDGLTLADETLPSGWTWDDPTTALSIGTMQASATYTPADTKNYSTITQMFSFVVRPVTVVPDRLFGDVALDTMEAIVSTGFKDTGGTVVLATLDKFPDALTASGIAGLAEAPILLTTGTTLSEQTAAELLRLKPTTIIVCGGTASVSDAVASAAKEAAGAENLYRCAGNSRSATACDIYLKAQVITGSKFSTTAFVATGAKFADALAVAPYAYAEHCPVFLTENDGTLSQETIDAMVSGGIKDFYILGGTAAVSDSIKEQLSNKGISFNGRLAGDDRYATCEAIAEFELENGLSADGMGLATGENYKDALTGAALCGKSGSVLLIVSDTDTTTIDDFVQANRTSIAHTFIFGGPSAVSVSLESYFDKTLN